LSEENFIIQRASNPAFTSDLVTFTVGQNVVTYTDTSYQKNRNYYYRVFARNVVGDTYAYPAPAVGFPHWTVNSGFSNTVGAPSGTTTLISLTQANGNNKPVVVDWTYSPGGDQTGFTIERATNANFTVGRTVFKVGANVTTYSDTTISKGTLYYYRVAATNDLGMGPWSNVMSILTNP